MALKPMHKLLVAVAAASILCLVVMMMMKKRNKVSDIPPLPPMYTMPASTTAPPMRVVEVVRTERPSVQPMVILPSAMTGQPRVVSTAMMPTGPPEIMGYSDDEEDWSPVS